MTRKQIEKRVIFWQKELGLHNWDIEVFFDLKKKSKSETRNFITAAHTDAHPEYKLGSISFNPKMLHTVNDETIIHELLHCLTSYLIGSACNKCINGMRYYNETITSELSRIILRIKDYGTQIKR